MPAAEALESDAETGASAPVAGHTRPDEVKEREGTKMKKAQILARWEGLKANQEVSPQMVAYKHTGSTYNEDSIRITGRTEFIDSVLSRLKDLLAYENGSTRLQVSYQEANDKDSGLPLGSYCAYVQVHERGREAQMMNAFVAGLRSK